MNPLRRDLALMIGVFAALRIYAVAGLDPVRSPDSPGYFRLDLLGDAERLWTVPLLYNVLPSDGWRVAGQVAIAIGCWGALAYVVSGLPRNAVLGRVGALLILLLALTPQVTQWDLIILSESVTLSLSALVAAALLVVARRRTRATLGFLVAALTLWAFTRHINLILLFALLPVAVVIVLARLERRRALALGAVLLVIGAWGAWAMAREENVWRLNSYAILTNRILPDPERTEYFTGRGLTVTPEMRIGDLNARGPAAPGLRDPRTQEFLRDRWRTAFLGWLLRNPHYLLIEPWHHARTPFSAATQLARPRDVVPGLVGRVAFSPKVSNVPRDLVLIAVVWIAAWWRRRDATAVDAAAAALAAISALWFMLVWHTSTDLVRPTLPAATTLRIGLLVLALLSADRLLVSLRRHGRSRAGAEDQQRRDDRVRSGAGDGGAAGPGPDAQAAGAR